MAIARAEHAVGELADCTVDPLYFAELECAKCGTIRIGTETVPPPPSSRLRPQVLVDSHSQHDQQQAHASLP